MIKHKINKGGNIIYHIWDNKGKYSFTLEQSDENRCVYNLFRIGDSTILKSVSEIELHNFIEKLPAFIEKIN